MFLWVLYFPTHRPQKQHQGPREAGDARQGQQCRLGSPCAPTEASSLPAQLPALHLQKVPSLANELQHIPLPRRCLYASTRCDKLWARYLRWLPENQASCRQHTSHQHPARRSCHKRNTALPRAHVLPPMPQLFGATFPGHSRKHGLPGQQGPTDHPRQGRMPATG